jgi:hypothetical protein
LGRPRIPPTATSRERLPLWSNAAMVEVFVILVALVICGIFFDLPLHYLMQHIRKVRSERRGNDSSILGLDAPRIASDKSSQDPSSPEKSA